MSQTVDPTTAEAEFRRFLSSRDLKLESESVASGLAASLAFFSEVRFATVDDPDGDMMLFQWGTYDWGHGERFELNITRQLAWEATHDETAEEEDDDEGDDDEEEGDPDPELWQLSLTFRFEPNDELRALGAGDQWCDGLSALDELRAYIDASGAFQATAARTDAAVTLSFRST